MSSVKAVDIIKTSRYMNGSHSKILLVFLQVVAQVNNGAGEFKVSVRPKHTLCDGMFHRVAGMLQSPYHIHYSATT